MKYIRTILSLTILGLVIFFAGCGKKDDPKPAELNDQQKATKALKDGSPWDVTAVTGTEVTLADVSPMKISFGATGSGVDITPTTFSTSSGDVQILWTTGAGATWSWSGTAISTIALTNASTNQLTNVQFLPNVDAPTSVKLTFIATNPEARVGEIGGTYTVTLE